MAIPLIDFHGPDRDTQIDRALREVGFMSLSNTGIPTTLVEQVFRTGLHFFEGDESVKQRTRYVSASENFGYQGVGEENLDPSRPADLKQTFTMRNPLSLPERDSRWPSAEFRQLMCELYRAAMTAANHLQRVLAGLLEQEEDFFVRAHNGENITLRLLYYPSVDETQVSQGQLGAGEHTDYGLLTFLLQDEQGGLQVLDAQSTWHTVPSTPGSVVINSGDLLERWTNGRYRSTLHRVQPRTGGRQRLSVALFVDPDSSTQVAALPSCVSDSQPAMFPPISAGEHLQQKIQASHKNRFAV